MRSAAIAAAVAFDLAVVVFHMLFPRLFAWERRLPRAGAVNAAITRTQNLMLIYVGLAYACGVALLAAGGGSAGPPLAIGAGFWLVRAAAQPWQFGLAAPLSRIALAAWILGATLHALPLLER